MGITWLSQGLVNIRVGRWEGRRSREGSDYGAPVEGPKHTEASWLKNLQIWAETKFTLLSYKNTRLMIDLYEIFTTYTAKWLSDRTCLALMRHKPRAYTHVSDNSPTKS